MKNVQLTIIAIYAFIIGYLTLFNWQVVILSLNVNIGFTTIKIPLIAGLMFLALIMLLLQWMFTKYNQIAYEQRLSEKNKKIDSLSQNYELSSLKKDNELNALKSSFFEKEAAQLKENSVSLADLYSQLDRILNLLSPNEQSQHVKKLDTSKKNFLT